jgi:hypothetical protein
MGFRVTGCGIDRSERMTVILEIRGGIVGF